MAKIVDKNRHASLSTQALGIGKYMTKSHFVFGWNTANQPAGTPANADASPMHKSKPKEKPGHHCMKYVAR
jgi:hypothetical protein